MRAKTEQLIKKAQELDEDIEMHGADTAVLLAQKQNPILLDRVYQALQESCVILEDFTQLPTLRAHNGQLYFLSAGQSGSQRSLTDVVDSRQDYFNLRLALAEERVFSHTDKF